jgi:hypothetical protein
LPFAEKLAERQLRRLCVGAVAETLELVGQERARLAAGGEAALRALDALPVVAAALVIDDGPAAAALRCGEWWREWRQWREFR